MCLFPTPNHCITSPAYKAGLTQFECGHCPECLSKRSNAWALRAVAESNLHSHNCMVTLTYDNYERDSRGRLTGRELPVDRDIPLSVRDCQLFIKRLRKYFNSPIKYLLTAEHGSHTGRSHYHCLLFGVHFEDARFLKRSKRGHFLKYSPTLSRLWSHGICTIDNDNITAATAAYCTKYSAKSRCDDTFMLVSQSLGLPWLLSHFNGISYTVDGRVHSIPRIVWQHYIMQKYGELYPDITYKYVNKFLSDRTTFNPLYPLNVGSRAAFRAVRDLDPEYQSYLSYWRNKSAELEKLRPDVLTRIHQLPDAKYSFYKQRALIAYGQLSSPVKPVLPGCTSQAARYHSLYAIERNLGLMFNYLDTCRITTCHNTASDTKTHAQRSFLLVDRALLLECFDDPPDFSVHSAQNLLNEQISLDI